MPEQQTETRPEHPGSSIPDTSPPPAIKLPLIAISGSYGKTSTGWMLVDLLEQAGLEVGAWLSNGVYVDRALRDDELHAWELANLAARAREIDALVQEIPTVLAGGLPSNSVQVAVFTSICGSDGQCQRGTTARRDQEAARSVAAAVDPGGRIVANADDLMIVDAVAGADTSITYYALSGANPVVRNHVDAGGDACWVQSGWIKVHRDGTTRRLIPVSEVPNTLRGHLLFQVQNALAAIAAALPLAGEDAKLVNAITAIRPSKLRHQIGVYEVTEDGKTLLADEPRTIQAIRQLARGIRTFAPKRVVVCFNNLNQLTEEEGREAARILGSLAGKAVLVEDPSSNRKLEQLQWAMLSSHDPPAITVRQESQATVQHIFSLLEEGDIALVLTENPGTIESVRNGRT